MKSIKFIIAAAFAAGLLAACSSSIILVDRMGTTFNLKEIKLSEGDSLEVLDSEAVRKLSLKDIRKLVLDASMTYHIEGHLYYMAIIELNNGIIIQPVKTGEDVTKSYVNIHNTIIGEGTGGTLTIPLEDVNVISMPE